MPDLTFNQQAGRFTDSTGRFVSEARVRAAVDAIADQASERMAAASTRLLAGEMSLGAWQAEVMTTIRVSHVAAAVIGHGGVEQMTFSTWGAIGPAVKAQYQYLAGFAEQIASGEQPLTRGVISRSAMYGQSARGSFARALGMAQQVAGERFERNVMAGEACAGCRTESARGLVPIGSLVPVGSRRPCGPNCRCHITYSRDAAVAA